MHFTLALFERRVGSMFECVTLGLGPGTKRHRGRNLEKVRAGLIDDLRPAIEAARPHLLRRHQLAKGVRLERVRLELSLTGDERRKVTGVFPIVIEPRWASADERMVVAYHPDRQEDCLPVRLDLPLDEQLRPFFSRAWSELDDDDLRLLWTRGKERLDVLSFSCSTRSLLEDLPERDRDEGLVGADVGPRSKRRRALKVLPHLGVNLTERAARGDLDVGLPRSPQRDELRLLLGAGQSRPVIVVGPPGSGKTTLIHHAVKDLLELDGYPAHRNLDRVREVWQLSGRRLIAGMKHYGDWEKRGVEVLADLEARDVILVIDDLSRFGQIGRSRESDRSLAHFFRGPLARRQIVMVGECTAEQLALFEEEAPAFAALFVPLELPSATPAETLTLMIREVRAIEAKRNVEVDPFALRSVIELSGGLLGARAYPGKALEPLRELARAVDAGAIEPAHALALFSRKTGVPEILLRERHPLDPADVEAAFAGQVMGQDEAVSAAVDLVCRVKTGLVDPRRPYGVYLFTGPTGTGKTELAKCLCEYLYGSPARLVRFDMSEYSGPDAPSRLLGHRYRPEGLLTRPIQEQPFSLILLDEIEKAHRSVHALLLQLFEDGRLTDAAGRPASYQHSVVVMTSNLGARPRAAVGFGEAPDAVLRDIARAVREFFPPELFNRIDRVVPFRPLTREIAERVAGKELDKLCQRRGLAERGIFVDPAPSVLPKVAAEAFAARDGARSVKRFLEDQVGSRITEAITSGARASMQILRVRADDAGFHVDREALEEASPAAATWALEPLLELPVGKLKERLPGLLAFVDELESSGALARLSERIRHHLGQQGDRGHAEAVYNLDAMRARLQAFRERVELFRRTPDEETREAVEHRVEVQQFGWVRVEEERSRPQRYRLFSRPGLAAPTRGALKGDVLDAIAEGHWLRRALRKVDEPGQHAVFVELERTACLGERARFGGERQGLFEWMRAVYYSAHGEVEEWASGGPGGAFPEDPDHLPGMFVDPQNRAVLKIVGLCALDFLELEAGLHVWTSLSRGPEVVRVQVTPAEPGVTARDVVSRPPRRDVPPVVRKIRFDPPARGAPPTLLELEDYAMGHAATMPARSLLDGFATLWLLRRSREEAAS